MTPKESNLNKNATLPKKQRLRRGRINRLLGFINMFDFHGHFALVGVLHQQVYHYESFVLTYLVDSEGV